MRSGRIDELIQVSYDFSNPSQKLYKREIGGLVKGSESVKCDNLTNIVLNKIGKKEKEVVTKAENNYLSSECSNSTTSYGKINTICANNLASAQRKNQVHHKKIGGR